MSINFADEVIRRSRLIMPVNKKKFVEKAFLRNADAIVLDLEDSIPDSEKKQARNYISESIHLAAKGGSDVIVRVNNEELLIVGDIEAAVDPKLHSLYIPKVETKKQIIEIDSLISKLEEKKGVPHGQIKIGLIIETVKGYLNLEEFANASERIDSLTLGAEDFSLDSGIEISDETLSALMIPRMKTLFLARAHKKIPLGLLSSIADYNDLESIYRNATLAYKHGFLGASCIHPSNVEILNECFTPTVEEYEYSSRLIVSFEKSLTQGRASMSLDGKMVDYPHYKKAQNIVNRYNKIQEFELKKKSYRKSARGCYHDK
ncbi:CoA ester lyase [Virgibacillus sp. C22-A2]|uniref:CoA ester lyase n=1 Tax=Virgibacillus tibetensis TaxID=3042313 RepID=A0ABU6KDD0_9BACI|nr:CoA ester lyase [Virgibacillus sp. C22-A2]